MTLPVFWVPVVPDTGAEVDLEDEEGRHAVLVRRIRPGEHVRLGDGHGRIAACEVLETGRATLRARVLDVVQEPEPSPHVTVVQAIPKGERGELAVETLTEVGADRIVPWPAARCVAVWRGQRAERSLARWRRAASEAAKQSRRARIPEVTQPLSTEGVAAMVRGVDLCAVLDEQAASALGALDPEPVGTLLVVVGPEGGLTREEIAALAGAGGHVVRLGASVLRTSTAGVAAVAALLARTPRWS